MIQLALLVPERVVILLCFAAFHAREIADMPLGVIPVRQLHVEVAYKTEASTRFRLGTLHTTHDTYASGRYITQVRTYFARVHTTLFGRTILHRSSQKSIERYCRSYRLRCAA